MYRTDGVRSLFKYLLFDSYINVYSSLSYKKGKMNAIVYKNINLKTYQRYRYYVLENGTEASYSVNKGKPQSSQKVGP